VKKNFYENLYEVLITSRKLLSPNKIECNIHHKKIFRKQIEKIDQSEFDGFEYVNPLLMSLEDCV